MIQLHSKQKRWFRPFLVTGIAIAFAGLPVSVRAQDRGATQNPSPAASANVSAGASASVNISGDESRSLDQFLDSHAEIARQLRSNPALANDPDYLRANPELRDYLQQHPQLQSALRQNAGFIFNRQQQQMDAQDNTAARDNDDRDRAQAQVGANADRDNLERDAQHNPRTEESARIDQFLDDHPNIAKDLKSKPANVNDDNYLKKHSELAVFLRDNPNVRDECQRNPAYFEDRDLRAQMIRTDFPEYRDEGFRPDAQEDRRAELNQFDRFLDSHPEIAEQLRKDPSLADSRQFVQDHPALQTYLQENPAIRDQLARDPNVFMHQEDNFDNRDRDRFANFRQFMDEHPRIREDVWKNPAVVKDHDYVNRNPELSDYLNNHPDVRDAWSANPGSFVKGAQQVNASGMTTPGGAPAAASPASPDHTGTTGTGSPTMGTGSSSNPATPSKTKQ